MILIGVIIKMGWRNSHGWRWNFPYTKIDGSGYVKFCTAGGSDSEGELYLFPYISSDIWDSYSQIKIEFKFCFIEVILNERIYKFDIQGFIPEIYYFNFCIYQENLGSFRAIIDKITNNTYLFPFEQGQFYTCIIELDKTNFIGRMRIIEYPLEFSWTINCPSGYPVNLRFAGFHPTPGGGIYAFIYLDYVRIWGKE